jgi:surface polysaccharide O-acyltransferase-like enzyme
MRSIGVFLVVLAHTDVWGGGPDWVQKIYYTISRNGVPVFFLISGYLLLSKQEDLPTFMKKRAAKVLVPFFVWSMVYDVFFTHSFGDAFTLESVLKLFIRILRGPRAPHLWFFYAIIGLYFFTPILRTYITKAKSSDILFYVGMWFLTVPILFIVEEFTPLRSGFDLYYFMGYVGYFLLGFLLGNLQNSPRLSRLALGLATVGMVSTFAVFYLDLPPVDNELPFRSYPSLNIILMAIGVFILLKAAGERISPNLARFFGVISQSSFGIYLIHSIILNGMVAGWQALGYQTAAGPSIIVIPLVALIAFLLSWTVTAIMRTIPIVRATVP